MPLSLDHSVDVKIAQGNGERNMDLVGDKMDNHDLMESVVSDIVTPNRGGSGRPPTQGTTRQTPYTHPELSLRYSTSVQPSPNGTTPRSKIEVHLPARPSQSSPLYVQKTSVMPAKRSRHGRASDQLPTGGEAAGALRTQPRKRGRPTGWQPGRPYAPPGTSRVRVRRKPAPGAAAEPKRRGRPPKAPEKSVREHYLQSTPDYVPFKCEWREAGRECPAELQNMETLRRHVSRVHGAAGGWVCRWGKCAAAAAPAAPGTEKAFGRHMEARHLESYAWHMGDGYQNRGLPGPRQAADEQLPRYLFDRHGNQVTPSVRDQALEDEQAFRRRKRKLQALLWEKNEKAVSDEDFRRQILGLEPRHNPAAAAAD